LFEPAQPPYDRSVREVPSWGWGETIMPKLSAPTVPVFLISVVLAVLALLGHFTNIQYVTTYQFWLAIVAYLLLFLGAVLKGF
jgi:hypothetical protein